MRHEVTKYQTQLDMLVSFAEGRLDGPALDAALATAEMKALLSVFEEPRYPALTNHYRRLNNNQDRTTLGGLVNSEGIIEDFLQKAEVVFHPAKRSGSIYRLILKAIPEYLDPPLDFMTEKVVPSDSSLSDAQRTKLIKQRLEEYFKFVEKPPKWVHPAEACAAHRAERDSADQRASGFMEGIDFEFEEFVVSEAIGLALHGADFVIGTL